MDNFEEVDVNDKVKHPKFGSGTVLHRSGTGENAKVRVKFSAEHGEKRLVVKYAKLKKMGERPTLAPAADTPAAAPAAEASAEPAEE